MEKLIDKYFLVNAKGEIEVHDIEEDLEDSANGSEKYNRLWQTGFNRGYLWGCWDAFTALNLKVQADRVMEAILKDMK